MVEIILNQKKKKNKFLDILIFCTTWSRYQQQASWESLPDQFSVAKHNLSRRPGIGRFSSNVELYHRSTVEAEAISDC